MSRFKSVLAFAVCALVLLPAGAAADAQGVAKALGKFEENWGRAFNVSSTFGKGLEQFRKACLTAQAEPDSEARAFAFAELQKLAATNVKALTDTRDYGEEVLKKNARAIADEKGGLSQDRAVKVVQGAVKLIKATNRMNGLITLTIFNYKLINNRSCASEDDVKAVKRGIREVEDVHDEGTKIIQNALS